jgi:hypothetical protein
LNAGSSEEENSSSEEEYDCYNFSKKPPKNLDAKLYSGARLTVQEFSLIFMATINKIGVAKNQIDPILELFRLVLPVDNELPTSFNIMKSFLNNSSVVKMNRVCKICCKELDKTSETCENDSCANNKLKKKTVKVFESNISEQIRTIFENHLCSMIRYKGILVSSA